MGDQSMTYTPDEAISAIGFGKFQGLVLVYAGFGWISEAMEMMLLSVVGVAVQSEWKLSPSEESLLTSVVMAGTLVGAYFWGIIADAYGRRRGFIGAVTVLSIAGICCAFSPNYILLLVFRSLVGFGVGGNHVFASWFLEFIPTPNRGAWAFLLSIFWSLGTVIEASLSWVFPTSVRTTGVGSATSIGRIGGIISPLVAVGLVRDCHQAVAIVLFEAVIVLMGFSVALLPFETTGRGLSDTVPLSKEKQLLPSPCHD